MGIFFTFFGNFIKNLKINYLGFLGFVKTHNQKTKKSVIMKRLRFAYLRATLFAVS